MNIRKITLSVLAISMLTASVAPESHAQRRKRKSENTKLESVKKEAYEIAIILPYEKAGKNADANSHIINFYEGVKLGLKEIDDENIKLNVKTHVLDQNKQLNFDNFAYLRELKKSDLLIAPVSGNIINDIANYADQHKINFISTLSPFYGDEAANNHFHILQPTLQTNIQNLVQYGKKQFPKNKKIVIYSSKDLQNYAYVKEELKGDRHVVNYDTDVIKLDVKNLAKQLDSAATNVIYLTSVQPKITDEILSVIIKLPTNYQIEVLGLPTLFLNQKVKSKTNNNISYYYTTPFFFDQNTAFIKKINQAYKETYKKQANDMVYRGYETIIWYARILKKYGTQFQFSRYDNMDSPYTPFIIKEVRNESNEPKYYENKYLFIYKYTGGILHIIEQ